MNEPTLLEHLIGCVALLVIVLGIMLTLCFCVYIAIDVFIPKTRARWKRFEAEYDEWEKDLHH